MGVFSFHIKWTSRSSVSVISLFCLQVKSVNVTSAQNTSLVVIVQPCNEYSFQVEFSQESFWRSKIHKYKSGVTKFKTQGIPTIKPTFDWLVQ